ncbi:lipopolysaccharide biosynthesis protein [Paraburkholderia sp. J67]|uniref:lipopolysaccharide biosynthesis protein n=1 Tax=Paraburkholderia sp. J67 TaxID=2805435 RepID=UPI002ABE796E|nr:oligosaccharide flippase family protein [Paraburkholderia sp. J67]
MSTPRSETPGDSRYASDDATTPRVSRRRALGGSAGLTVFVAKFLSREAVVQGLNFIGGIWVVRALTVHEYAWYTIAITMLGAGSVLSDMGVSAALMSLAGRLWPDRPKVNRLFTVAYEARAKFFALFGTVVFGAGFFLLTKSQASWPAAAAIMVCVVAVTFFQLNFSLLSVLPKLEQNLKALQQITISGAALRLVLLAALLISANTLTALFAALVAIAWQAWAIRRRYDIADQDTHFPLEDARAEFSKVARRQAPASIYFCIQGQLNVLLLGYFGSATQVAQLGALGRISALLMVAQSLFASILMPRYAVLKDKADMLRKYVLAVSAFLVLIAVFLCAAWLFPGTMLSVLGGQYAGLHGELLLILGSAALYVIEALLFSLNMSRAWITPSWIQVVVTLAFQAVLLAFMPIDSIARVVIFSSISPVVSIAVYVASAALHFGRMEG